MVSNITYMTVLIVVHWVLALMTSLPEESHAAALYSVSLSTLSFPHLYPLLKQISFHSLIFHTNITISAIMLVIL